MMKIIKDVYLKLFKIFQKNNNNNKKYFLYINKLIKVLF